MLVRGKILTRHVTNNTQLDMQDGDTLEVHQEQIGGGC
jgi:hypothetical protein